MPRSPYFLVTAMKPLLSSELSQKSALHSFREEQEPDCRAARWLTASSCSDCIGSSASSRSIAKTFALSSSRAS